MSQIQVDATITLSLIVMFCSILSPILTAFINNQNMRRMKAMEYQHLERQEERKHQLDVYEGYIRAVGVCIDHPSPDTLTDLSVHTRLILYYIPDENLRDKIIALEYSVRSGNTTDFYEFEQPFLEVIDLVAQLKPELPPIDYDGCLMRVLKSFALRLGRLRHKLRSSAK